MVVGMVVDSVAVMAVADWEVVPVAGDAVPAVVAVEVRAAEMVAGEEERCRVAVTALEALGLVVVEEVEMARETVVG